MTTDAATPTVTILPLLLSREQVAAALGGCSASHVDRLDRAGKLGPCPIRLGSCVRWSAAELADWVAAGCPARVEWGRRRSTNPQSETPKSRKELKLRDAV